MWNRNSSTSCRETFRARRCSGPDCVPGPTFPCVGIESCWSGPQRKPVESGEISSSSDLPALAQGWVSAQPLMDVRTTVDPRTIKTQAERVVRSLGRQYSLRTMTLEERLNSYLSVQRLTALLAAFFGAVALLIASIGLYGLMSFPIARRTSELGIRLALGAQRQQVLIMVLREAVSLASFGCVLGLRLACWQRSSSEVFCLGYRLLIRQL